MIGDHWLVSKPFTNGRPTGFKLGEKDSPLRAGHLFSCTYYTSYCLLELLNHEPESTEMMSGNIYCLLNMWWLLRTCMDGCVSSLPNPVTRSKMIKINNVWIALFVVFCCFAGMPTVRLFNNLILIMHFWGYSSLGYFSLFYLTFRFQTLRNQSLPSLLIFMPLTQRPVQILISFLLEWVSDTTRC